MSSSVFAHAVYGVILTGEAEKKLRRYVDKTIKKWEESEDERYDSGDRYYEAVGYLDEKHKKLMAALRVLAGVPPDANFYYTGDGDDSVGESATDDDTWIAGYGLMEFPRAVDENAFRDDTYWHQWVTGSG